MNLNILNQKVDLLKNNIQEIIDNCKIEHNLDIKKELCNKKNLYLEELDTTLSNIKQIKKEEKHKNNRESEIRKVIRHNDSMKYHSIRNKPNAVELMNEQKKNREKAKDVFDKQSELKKIYNNLEETLNCKEYPAFLFFHKSIIDKYTLCPFIELNDTSLDDRKKWLFDTVDKGEQYYNLYNKLINRNGLEVLILNKQDIELYFENINASLDEQDIKTLNKIHEYIKEYKSSPIKTKKLKEKFNVIINNSSIIVNNNNIKINEFLSMYYDLVIPVNDIIESKSLRKTEMISFNISKIYDDKLDEYRQIREQIDNTKKFITNTVNNLNQELFDYIYKKSNEKKTIRQEGKYCRKWSKLLKEEKIDRFESYADYFIKKYILEPSIITDKIKILRLIDELKLLLTVDGFDKIKYKNLKWNPISGIIENINCLKYDEINQKFFLAIGKESIKNTGKESIVKINSTRTIINKDTDKIINEELMKHLIVAKKDNRLDQENIKNLKDSFFDKIKEKLKLKRIMINDRNQVNKTFDTIYNIIYNDT